MDKTKDTHKIQKECERKREEYEIASVNLENPNFRPTNVRGVRGIYRGNSQSTLTDVKGFTRGLGLDKGDGGGKVNKLQSNSNQAPTFEN